MAIEKMNPIRSASSVKVASQNGAEVVPLSSLRGRILSPNRATTLADNHIVVKAISSTKYGLAN